MKLTVSSIAWTKGEEADIAALLQSLGVQYVELAPTKIWEDPIKATPEQVQEQIDWWAGYGIRVSSFQSMLFTRPDLKLFESDENRNECLEYMTEFIRLAGAMNAQRMVFGSPKNRRRGSMSLDEATIIARDFFSKLGDAARENNVILCIEPNAPQYNCDYITSAEEGAELVRSVANPGFGLHLDTACMALAGDDLSASIIETKDILEHFHISSPMLELIEDRHDVDHRAAAAALREIDYHGYVSLEMRPGDMGENVERVKSAILFAQEIYN